MKVKNELLTYVDDKIKSDSNENSAEGGSLSRMQSKANSGKSNTDMSRLSSTFSTLEVRLFLTRDIPMGIWHRKPIQNRFLNSLEIVLIENSWENKRGNSHISDAHDGRGLRRRDFKNKKKEMQVMK